MVSGELHGGSAFDTPQTPANQQPDWKKLKSSLGLREAFIVFSRFIDGCEKKAVQGKKWDTLNTAFEATQPKFAAETDKIADLIGKNINESLKI